MDTSGAGLSIQRPHQAHEWRPAVDDLGSHFDDSRVSSIFIKPLTEKEFFQLFCGVSPKRRAGRAEQIFPVFLPIADGQMDRCAFLISAMPVFRLVGMAPWWRAALGH